MRALLIHPPATDARSPHLAIPSLAAALRSQGFEVTARDLNIEGMEFLAGRDVLTESLETCRSLRSSGSQDPRLSRLVMHGDLVVEQAAAALTALRSEAFYDADLHHQARSVLSLMCELHAAARLILHYNIIGARFAVDGVDIARIADLDRVTAEARVDIFAPLTASLIHDLETDRPDLVGISILNHQQVIPGLTIARQLRAAGHRVVLGGTVYAKFVDQLQRKPEFLRLFADAVVVYEGETALAELTARAARGEGFAGTPNTIALDRGVAVLGPLHVETVSELPTPDFSVMPLDAYLTPEPVLPILTGKGCYYNKCRFCDIPAINALTGKAYRMRDPARVADDVATLHLRHGARHFEITDEALAPRFLLQLGAELEHHPAIEPRFVGYARFEAGFTDEVCERLHAMGVRKLFFGLESGSQTTLDHMAKGIRLDTVPQVLAACRNHGIAVHIFSIIGFPEETEAAARQTIQFFLDNRELLDDAANSFDVHPFGLDLRTEYGDNPANYSIRIDPSELTRDFPISVASWANEAGLEANDVQTVLGAARYDLREGYRRTRWYPADAWPGFEEYAVLYSSRYGAQPFPHRLTLPADDSGTRHELRWAPTINIERYESGYVIHSVGGRAPCSGPLMQILGCLPIRGTAGEILGVLADRAEHAPEDRAGLICELRDAIDPLVGSRVLWLRPVGATSRPSC